MERAELEPENTQRRSNDYQFVTHWRVRGTVQEVWDVLSGSTTLAEWWPSVYLAVDELVPGDASGVGRVVDLYTKGWLPYTLRWQFRIVESNPPHGFAIEAWGDFVGRGVWSLQQSGSWVDVIYDWRIRAEKPVLRSLSFMLKPLFAANHHWAMAQGEESLRLELARRRASSETERACIPAPPGPTHVSAGMIGAGGALTLGLLFLLARGFRRGA